MWLDEATSENSRGLQELIAILRSVMRLAPRYEKTKFKNIDFIIIYIKNFITINFYCIIKNRSLIKMISIYYIL